MKKIAILTCLEATSSVCASVGCFSAFNNKTGAFKPYLEEDIVLSGFFQCNGCGQNLSNDDGLKEKVERVISIKPDIIHVGICTKKRDSNKYCQTINELIAEFESHNIQIVFGTH